MTANQTTAKKFSARLLKDKTKHFVFADSKMIYQKYWERYTRRNVTYNCATVIRSANGIAYRMLTATPEDVSQALRLPPRAETVKIVGHSYDVLRLAAKPSKCGSGVIVSLLKSSRATYILVRAPECDFAI